MNVNSNNHTHAQMPTYLSYNADLLRYVLDVGVYNNTVNIPKRIIPTGDTGRGGVKLTRYANHKAYACHVTDYTVILRKPATVT